MPGLTRPDWHERHEFNKNNDHVKVKCTWNTLCTPLGRLLKIEELLEDLNQAKWEAGILANFHVLRVLEEGLEVPLIDLGFFYNCLRAVSEGREEKIPFKDPVFAASVEAWKTDCRGPGYQPANSWNASAGGFNVIAKEMLTNAQVGVHTECTQCTDRLSSALQLSKRDGLLLTQTRSLKHRV